MVRRLETEDELARAVAALARRVRDLEAKPAPRAWIEIEDQVLSSPAASITFSSITDRYRHLMLVGMVRSTRASTVDVLLARLNGDSGGNYDWIWTHARHETTTSQPVFASGGGAGATAAQVLYVCADSTPANIYSPFRVLFPDYRNTSIYKSYEANGGMEISAGAEGVYKTLGSGTWKSTSAVTQIELSMLIENFDAQSRVTLYGLG
jgi:hypothetical protein